jgi:hypothetical protein
MVQGAQILDKPAEVVLVIGGYMAPELTAELSKVHRVLVVASETIQSDLTALVADLTTPVPAALPETSLRELDQMPRVLASTGRQLDLVTEALASSGGQLDLVTEALASSGGQLDLVAQALAALAEDRDRQWSSLARQVGELSLAQGIQRETNEIARRTPLPSDPGTGQLMVAYVEAEEDAQRDGQFRAEWAHGGRSATIKGRCPACGHLTSAEFSLGIGGSKGFRRTPRPAILPSPVTMFCECGHAHDGRPPDAVDTGCGRFWAVHLTEAERRPMEAGQP